MEFHDLHSTNYAACIQKLCNELTSIFPEFRRDEIEVNLFAHQFDLAVEGSPDDCQMELIDLQADMDTKRGYSGNRLVDFYKLSVKTIPICPIIQEKLSPSLVAPTSLSNSFQNEAYQNQLSK